MNLRRKSILLFRGGRHKKKFLSVSSDQKEDDTMLDSVCRQSCWRRCGSRFALVAALAAGVLLSDAQAGPMVTLAYKGTIEGLPATATISFEDLRIGVNPAGFFLAGERAAWARQDALNGRIYVGAEVLTPTARYVLNGDVQSTSDWGYADAVRTDAFERFLVRLDFSSDANFVYIDRFSLTPNPLDQGSTIYYFTLDVPAPPGTPVLAAIPNQTVNEGGTLTFTASATDADLPAQALTFTLDAGAPAGAAINPSTGVFSWTPTEAQGPSTNSITVRVSDTSSPALSDTKTFTVVVNESNVAPVLAAIADQTINLGETLAFSVLATDRDQPAQALTFSLESGAPAGAAVNAQMGVFTWTPAQSQGPGPHTFAVRVTDDGAPNLSDTKTFTIVVTDSVSELKLTGIVLSTEGASTIKWKATPGSTYRLFYKNSLDAPGWSLVGEMVATGNIAVLEDKTAAAVSQRFYRVERED
jgi:hypothetical protein